jgi:hypothetical protein
LIINKLSQGLEMNLLKPLGLPGVVLCLAVCGSLGSAVLTPNNSNRSDSQIVFNLHVGPSRVWKSCNGSGVYIGSGWEAPAYCKKNSEL